MCSLLFVFYRVRKPVLGRSQTNSEIAQPLHKTQNRKNYMLDQHLHGSWTRLLFTENSHYILPWGPQPVEFRSSEQVKIKKTLAATCVHFQVTRKLWSWKHCRIRGFVSNITASMKQMLDQMLGDGVIVVCCSDAIFNLHMGGVMEGPITFTWNKKWRQKPNCKR